MVSGTAVIPSRLGAAACELRRCAINIDEMPQRADCGKFDILGTKAGIDPRVGLEEAGFTVLQAPTIGRGDRNKPPIPPVIPISALFRPIQVTHLKLYQGSRSSRRPALSRQA